jgi:pilus assembly protein CpaE
MLKNEPYSTAVMTEAETNSPIVIPPVSEATVEGFAAAVMIGDLTSNRNLRQLLQDTGLVYPVYDWSNYHSLNTKEISPVPHIVFLELDSPSDLAFARDLRKVQPDIRLIACSGQKEPTAELSLEAMRIGVCDILRRPVERAELRNTLARIVREDAMSAPVPTPLGKLFVVMGTKGGVGTSTIAVNLGVQLAQIPEKRTVLLDFSRPLGDVSLLLDLHPRFRLWDAVKNVDRLDATMLCSLLTQHKSGLQVLPGAAHPDEWQQTSASSLARLIAVALGHFDFAVMDLGSMYSTDWKPILRSAEILLIAESDVPGLAKLERHLSVLSNFEVPFEKIRVVANRWRRQDEEALAVVEKILNVSIFARLPNDFHQVSEAATFGAPLEKTQHNPLVIEFRKLAQQLAQVAPEAATESGVVSGLFSFTNKAKGILSRAKGPTLRHGPSEP